MLMNAMNDLGIRDSVALTAANGTMAEGSAAAVIHVIPGIHGIPGIA
jgi:hypothetical protein